MYHDGAFRLDGTFRNLGFHQIELLTEAFRRSVLREFLCRELLSEVDARSMLAWEHSGFHVHHAVRLDADDACGILQLARYAARAPVSLQRLHDDARKQRVRVVSDKTEGPTAGTHDFSALEFLARLLTHVPDKSHIYVRYYGAYSVRRRSKWRNEGVLHDTHTFSDTQEMIPDDAPSWPQIQARRLGRTPPAHLRSRPALVSPLWLQHEDPRLRPRPRRHPCHLQTPAQDPPRPFAASRARGTSWPPRSALKRPPRRPSTT